MKIFLISAVMLSLVAGWFGINSEIYFQKKKDTCGKVITDKNLEEKRKNPHYRDIFETAGDFKTEYLKAHRPKGEGC